MLSPPPGTPSSARPPPASASRSPSRLANCARFIDRRCEGGGWPSYRELEAERDRLASFLDLKVTIQDRETLAHIRQVDLIRVLTARGWTKQSEWVDDVVGVYAEVWEKPGVEWPHAIVPADNVADREAKVSETIGDIARAEGIGALWVLAELLANPPAGPPAAGMPTIREEGIAQ
jgi:hypothetical protein